MFIIPLRQAATTWFGRQHGPALEEDRRAPDRPRALLPVTGLSARALLRATGPASTEISPVRFLPRGQLPRPAGWPLAARRGGPWSRICLPCVLLECWSPHPAQTDRRLSECGLEALTCFPPWTGEAEPASPGPRR